jgi:glucosamine 6-phosphate synthetase-like amidotransferase/phosphosugar isomerase protein
MCGVFGFVSRGGKANLKVLKRIAEATERRGPHAFGFAWIDGQGRIRCYKQTGKITSHLALLAMAADARMLIGHCRWATQGSPEQNINNHPHPSDGGWIVHNGVIADHRTLMEEFDLFPVSDCDSEVLGLLIEQEKGSMLQRCQRAVKSVNHKKDQGPLVLMGLWPRPARLVVVRRGNPLHFSGTPEGLYLASLADGLPEKSYPLKDRTVCLFTGKELHHAAV